MKNGKIKWITYNLENPPAEDIKYLITDGSDTDFGSIRFDAFDKEYRWFPYDNCEFGADHITHYAIINLPEKEVFDNKVFEKENKKMINFEIWTEGWASNEGQYGATKKGESEGYDFKNACLNFAQENSKFKEYYDYENNSYWGCKLFDNEEDARKSFG